MLHDGRVARRLEATAGVRVAAALVLVTLDTTRSDAFGCYGRGGDATPNFDALAAEGIVFAHREVTVRLQNSGRVVNGVGSDPDIVVASAKAYLSALNKLQSKADRVAAQG